jgi:hypothetical protein
MADDKPRATAKDPDRLPEDHWVENARSLLKASPYAVAGALSTSQRKTHSEDEAKQLVKEFLAREVPAEPAQED